MSRRKRIGQAFSDREPLSKFQWYVGGRDAASVFASSYALAITTGSAPSGNLDTSFMDNLGLQGYVSASGRGTVSGSYSGTLSGQAVTIGFKVRI